MDELGVWLTYLFGAGFLLVNVLLAIAVVVGVLRAIGERISDRRGSEEG